MRLYLSLLFAVIVAAGAFGIVYLLWSFGSATTDIHQWSKVTRWTCVFVGAFAICAGASGGYEIGDDLADIIEHKA